LLYRIGFAGVAVVGPFGAIIYHSMASLKG